MSEASLVARQIRYEQRTFWRNPASAFFAFAFPIIFLVIFGTLNNGVIVTVNGVKVTYDDYYIPALVAFGLMGACFTNIAISISIRRESGLLKRFRGTPLPAWAFMTGVIGSSVIVAAILAALTTVFGMLAYHVHAPQHLLALVIVLAVGAMVFCALGLATAALIPNADAAPAIVNAALLPLVFISGTFFPINPDSVLAKIAEYFPVRHLITAVYAAFDPALASTTGIDGNDLLIMGAWGVAALFIAIRRFRWEPPRK